MNFCQVTESQAANPISSEGVCAFVFVFGSISRCPAGQGRPPATVPPHRPRRISGTATRVKGLSKTYNHHQGCNEVQHTDFGVVVWAGTRAQGQSEACLEAKLTGYFLCYQTQLQRVHCRTFGVDVLPGHSLQSFDTEAELTLQTRPWSTRLYPWCFHLVTLYAA